MKIFYFLNLIFLCIIYINKSYSYSYDFKDNQEISSGKRHTCSLKMGEVFCWGDNLNYQLGSLGNDSNIPRRVPNIIDAIHISAGGQHSCAVKKTGTVQCWGNNSFGQTGESIQATNVKISSWREIANFKNIKSVSLGENHSCALNNSGEVFCWGDNSEGQLASNTIEESSIPIQIPHLSKITMISSGNNHTCALHLKGEVFCWGDNRSGQIGNKRIQNKVSVNLVQNLKNVREISAGGSTTCATTKDNFVFCWGDNSFSQVGIENSLENKNAKILMPTKMETLQDVLMVSVGENHACALINNGTIDCWGSNSNNNFQLGKITKSSVHPTPIEVPNMLDMKFVSSGGLHSCGLKSNGSIYCWGNNYQGQLGNGNFSNSNGRPNKVTLTSTDSKIPNQFFLSCYFYDLNNTDSESGADKILYENSNFSFYWGIDNDSDASKYLTLNGHTEDGFFLETKLTYENAIESCNRVIYLKNQSSKKNNVFKLYDFKASFQENIQIKEYPILFTNPTKKNIIKRLVIFGDSLSDNGNLKEFTHYLPGEPYFKGRFSNGLVWGDYFSFMTELPILNFAYGGAKSSSDINLPVYKFVSYLKSGVRNLITGGMTNYVNSYIKHYLNWNSFNSSQIIQSPEETLYIIWIGGNDYLESMNSQKEFTKLIDNDSYQFSENIVNNIMNSITKLQKSSAKNFLVMSLPDIGMTPEAILNNNYNFTSGKFKKKEDIYYRLSEISQIHNSILKQKIEALNAYSQRSHIYYFDINPLLLKFINQKNFIDDTPFNYNLTYINSNFSFQGFEKNTIQMPCYKGDFKRNPIWGQFKSNKNLFCIEKKDLNFTKSLFWDSVHPTSYTHCLLSYAVHMHLGNLNLINKPKHSLFDHRNFCEAGFYERKVYN